MGPKMSGQVVSWRVRSGSPRSLGQGSDGWDDRARPGRTWPDTVGSPNTPAPIRASSLSVGGRPSHQRPGYCSRVVSVPHGRAAGLRLVQLQESLKSTRSGPERCVITPTQPSPLRPKVGEAAAFLSANPFRPLRAGRDWIPDVGLGPCPGSDWFRPHADAGGRHRVGGAARPDPGIGTRRPGEKRLPWPVVGPARTFRGLAARCPARAGPCRASRYACAWPGAHCGMSTPSMTWMTPLLASTSVAVTFTVLPAASVSETLSPSTPTVRSAPWTVVTCLAVKLHDVGSEDLPRHYVIGQDLGEITLGVLQECVDRSRRELGEGRIRRCEDRERTLPLEGLDQACRLEGRGECREVTRRNCGVDDVRARHRLRR